MPAVVIAANNLMPALRDRLAGGGRAPHICRHRADPGTAGDPGATAGVDRARTPVRGDAARRGAHQPDQDAIRSSAHAEVRVMSHTGDYSASGRQAVTRRRRRRRSAPAVGSETARRRRAPEARCAPARLARHTPRRALPRPARRRDPAGWQSRQRRRSVGRRRAGAVADHPAAESEGPRQHSERRLRDALPRLDRLGEVRAAEGRRIRRATAPASSSPTRTPPPSTSSARKIKV